MNRRRPILLLLLIAYIFSPSLMGWIFDTNGVWYRPFIIWTIVIAIAFAIAVQDKDETNDL